jgi:hypothetical protein
MTTKKTFDRSFQPFTNENRPNGQPYTARALRRKMIRLWYCTTAYPTGSKLHCLLKLRKLPIRKVLFTNRNYF